MTNPTGCRTGTRSPAHRRRAAYTPAHRLTPAPGTGSARPGGAWAVALPVAMVGLAAAAPSGTAALSPRPLGPVTLTAAVHDLAVYRVAPHDTLWGIAQHFGTSVDELATLNRLGDPNLITIGQRLSLPAAPGRLARPSAHARSYRVRTGDSLAAIAARFHTTAAHLAALNHLGDPNLIIIGQRLVVPGPAIASPAGSAGQATGATPAATSAEAGSTTTTTATATAPATSSTTATATAPASTVAAATYEVRAGDTLASIAARFGTTASHLAAVNHLSDPALILPGEELVLTASKSPSPAAAALAPPGAPDAALAVQAALDQLGKPYVWGGATPAVGFDCSGLVMYAWGAAGISLPHYSVFQYEDTEPVTAADLLPGDIVFYDTGVGPQPGHEAMYIGNGMVVSADEPGTVVQVQPMDEGPAIMGYRAVQ